MIVENLMSHKHTLSNGSRRGANTPITGGNCDNNFFIFTI
jgi:hypothetical protein